VTDEQLSTGHTDPELQVNVFVAQVRSAPCSTVRACSRPVVAYVAWQEEPERSVPLILEPTCTRHRSDARHLVHTVSGRIVREIASAELAPVLPDLRAQGFSFVLPLPHGAGNVGEVGLSTGFTDANTLAADRGISATRMRGQVPPHRAYIARRSQRFLPPGMVVRQVFGAQRFFPWLIGPLELLYTPFMRWRVVAVADDGIYVLKATYWLTWRPKRLLRRLPRPTRLGPVSGIWPRIQLGPERVWVNWRFFDDIDAADYDLRLALSGDPCRDNVVTPPEYP
jgi:hypothetical protein